jgi:hypothetical protein
VYKEYQYTKKSELPLDELKARLTDRLGGKVQYGYPTTCAVNAHPHIVEEMKKIGIPCRVSGHNGAKFEKYLKNAPYPSIYYSGNSNLREKQYEHFQCLQLLDPHAGGTYIDIAASTSPLWEVASTSGLGKWYAQDIMFAAGIHDHYVGCDAARLPFGDASIDGMYASCSLEHFENDADTLFFVEAERVLRKGAKLVIAPLYLGLTPFTCTDAYFSEDVEFDPETDVCIIDGWGNRHGRFYSPATLFSRLCSQTSSLNYDVLWVKDVMVLDPEMYCHFVLIAEKR